MRILKNINFALNSISKRLTVSFLLIIQLSAALYLLYNTVEISGKSHDNINKVEDIFHSMDLYSVEITDELDNLFGIKFKEESIIDKLKEFDDYLSNSNEFVQLRFNNHSIPVLDFEGNEEFIDKNSRKENHNNNSFSRFLTLQGDNNFFKNFNFKIASGRSFEDSDFSSTEVLPVILGYDYINKFKLNDTFKYYDDYSDSIKKMKVIGFLEKDIIFCEKTFSPGTIYNMNNYIVCPIKSINSLNEKSPNYEAYLRNIYFGNISDTLLISKYDSEFLDNLLQEKSNTLNLYNLEVDSLKDVLGYYSDMYSTQKQFLLIIFLIVVLFTAINMITSLLTFINKSKKEFAVHLMCGANVNDLIQRILFQVFILVFISFGGMLFVNYSLNKNLAGSYFNIKYILITALFAIFLSLFLTMIPVVSLMKTNLTNIIKED